MEDSEVRLEPRLKPQNNRAILLIAAVIFLTALAIWLVPDQSGPDDEPSDASKLLQPMTQDHASLDAPGQDEGVHARAYISQLRAREGQVDLPAAYREAQRLEKEEMAFDAYLLYFFAARHGHPEASFKLATLSDPVLQTKNQTGITQPDPAQAHKWYLAAQKAGVKDAGERLKQLRIQIEQQAKSGDRQAQRLALQWK